MNCRIGKLATFCAAIALTFGFVATASAQVFTGRVDVTIEDSTGGRLPGVSVDLSGPVTQNQVTDAQGEAHFLNLPVGIYTVSANLSGFNPFNNNNVQVATGAATPLAVRLSVAGTAETVNVTAATPIIDMKRSTTTTNVTLEELQNIPTARDPWVVMQTVPSIYVDRVNVGGSESGQQSNYIGKGSSTVDNTWNIDGVPITDMGATGSTPTYYAFDMFQEMSVTTGGADAQNPTPGVQLNLVLKKGTNIPHGNASIYFENQNLQSTNIPAELLASPEVAGSGGKGNRTDRYLDESFDLGGPIFKDRLFAWGSLGYTDVRNLTLLDQLDGTKLKNAAFKADGNITDAIRGNFAFFRGDKQKSGRGVGPTKVIESAWNQDGPTSMYKGEGNFVIGQKLFAAARYAYISSGFTLDPIGGRDKNFYLDDDGIWHNSYYFYTTQRPQHYVGGDASYFAGKHEVKFGFAWRKTPIQSISEVTGDQIWSIHGGYPDITAYAQRQNNSNTEGRYTNGYITDTISMDRFTVTAGIRFDLQRSSYKETTSPAISGVALMPSITAPGVPNAYKYNNVTPRVGLTYAVDEGRKTVARASYAMFASQLPGNAASFVSPIQPYTYVYYNAVDRQSNGQPCETIGVNGCDGAATLGEIDFASGVQGSRNVDLVNPGRVTSPNRVNADLKAPRTNELMFGVDREVIPNFGISATFTYRHVNNFIWNPGIGVTPASYVPSTPFTGTFENVGTVSIPTWKLASADGPGREAQNRPDYHHRYLGFEVSATKRMSNRWMGRVGFASTSWNEYFGGPNAILDPTRTPSASGQYVNYTASGPLVDGGPLVVQTAGSGKSGIYLLPPKYQLSANGLFQGPWGIDLGGNFVMRQGYGQPFFRSRVQTGDALVANKNVLLTQGADEFRLDSVSTLDVRVEKMFKFGRTNLAFDFDVFNLMNTATVLGKQYDARFENYNNILEIMNPRIARLGLRFFF